MQAGDPERIGPYRLVRELGSGGMGRVFLARSSGGRPVAVKVIRPDLAADPEFRSRFRHEVAAARLVNGLYTALVVDADVDGVTPWLATAYVAGPSLAEKVRAEGPLPAASVVVLAAGLAEGLGAIHAAGLVHRDLKPSNVLLADDGPRIIDFGISRAVEASSLTSTGLVVGSPGFMSPEQAIGGDIGPSSDVFSLGAVLTFAGTGRGPFGTGSAPALGYRVVHAEPDLAGVPAGVRHLVERCLAKNPGERPTIAELLAEFGDFDVPGDWLSSGAGGDARGADSPAAPAWPARVPDQAVPALDPTVGRATVVPSALPATVPAVPPPAVPPPALPAPGPARFRKAVSRPRVVVPLAAALAAAVGVAVLVALPSTPRTLGAASSSSAAASGGTPAAPAAVSANSEVVMQSSPEDSVTDNFNPFASTAAPQGMGATGLVYEPLTQFDLANPTVQYPWLATSYAWSNGGKSITFTIRQGVKWNNGTPLTPADVAFTFNYVKAHADINMGGLTISSVSTSGDTVTVNFPTPQYMNLEQIAGQAILPQSVWSSVSDPATFTDANPVGTGPYVVGDFTPTGFTMTRNQYYWQTVPVAKVYFPVYTTNTAAVSALFSGQIDWAGNYIPDLQQDFVDEDPVHHHFWEAAGSSNALWPNLNEWPTNQLAVRQAIDVAINRTAVGSEGESGLEAPLTNASGITLPTYQAWLAPSVAGDTVPADGSASQAEAILTQAGYTKDNAGYFALNGKEVALTIVEPAAYTDYAQSAALIAQELRAAGINATFDGIDVDAWNTDMASGNFQLAIHWGYGGITPYPLYDTWLDDTLIASGAGDFEHLQDPAVQADLQKLNGDQTVAEQTADLAPIEQYVADNLPVIATTTAADWFEYNSQHFTGWPTAQDPYDSGQPSGTNNGPGTGTDEVILLRLRPAS